MNVHVSRNGKVIGQFSEEEFRKNVRLGVIGLEISGGFQTETSAAWFHTPKNHCRTNWSRF